MKFFNILPITVLVLLTSQAAHAQSSESSTSESNLDSTSSMTTSKPINQGPTSMDSGISTQTVNIPTGTTQQSATDSSEPQNQQTTVESITEIPTTTQLPLDRNVMFKVDCTASSQCDFTFKIAERLMRYVNSTYLQQMLSDLTVKIQTISNEVGDLTTEETSYETYLLNQVNNVNSNFTELKDDVDNLNIQVAELELNSINDYSTIQRYLQAAQCFQNDVSPSVDCGNIAFPPAASTEPTNVISTDSTDSF